jgi:hypothetical protein
MPTTVAFAEEYVVVGDVLGFPPLGAAVLLLGGFLLLGVLLGALLQAATTSPAAAITAMADSREQPRSIRTSSFLCPGLDVNPG